ncbi:MAG: hypothetical protein RR404_01050 [Bacilli bacterium]
MFDLKAYLEKKVAEGLNNIKRLEMSILAIEITEMIEGLGYRNLSPDDIKAVKEQLQPTINFNKDNGISAELTIKPGEGFAFCEKCNGQIFSLTICEKSPSVDTYNRNNSRVEYLIDINGSKIGSVVTDCYQISFYNKESLDYAEVTDCVNPDEAVTLYGDSFSKKMLEGAAFADKKRAELGLTNGKTK